MGHLVGKDLYKKLGKKIDGQPMRAPWNEAFYAILKELYTSEEAELIVKMPYGLSTLEQIEKNTGFEKNKLQKLLDGLSAKCLVIDFYLGGKFRYIISPFVVGIFEFTMMRTGDNLKSKDWARLFNDYWSNNDSFYAANLGADKRVTPLRALPYEDAIADIDHVEILDYERVSAIVDQQKSFSVGICSCRHEKYHLGNKSCDSPLEMCTTMGPSTQFLIKRGMARAISKEEMREHVARSQEMGLVICADNVKNDISFLCHCCGCCCHILQGISKFGYPHALVTSSFIAEYKAEDCSQCGACVKACPIDAITMETKSSPEVDQKICVGCGVCAHQCPTESLRLVKRKQRVLHPADTFERIILQCLERGTLQNQMFVEPDKVSHIFMRGVVGGFLKLPPVKRALMSDTLRSSFLEMMRKAR